MQHAGGRIEVLARFEMTDRERCMKGGDRNPTAGADGACEPLDQAGVLRAAQQTEPALAQADERVVVVVRVEVAHIAKRERRGQLLLGGCGACELDEGRRRIDPMAHDPTPRERQAVPPWATTQVEHPHPRLEVERPHQERDFLLRPLRERIAQVRSPEILRNRIEPELVALRSFHATRKSFAVGPGGTGAEVDHQRHAEFAHRLHGVLHAC